MRTAQSALPDGSKVSVRAAVDLAYVIQGDDEGRSVKVGRSREPERRVAGLLSGVPFNARLVAVLDNGTAREREMKTLLAAHKLRGEWYGPSSLLNEYLAGVHRQNGLLTKRPVDDDLFESLIKPVILEYLNGRQPTFSDGGDLVYRVLHVGLPALKGRAGRLLTACPNVLTPELLAGYVPIEVGQSSPSVMTFEPASAA